MASALPPWRTGYEAGRRNGPDVRRAWAYGAPMSRRRGSRTPRRIDVSDAVRPIAMAEAFLGVAAAAAAPLTPGLRQHVGGPPLSAFQRDTLDLAGQITRHMLELWKKSPVVLRVDDDFVTALLTSDTSLELSADAVRTVAFDAVAFSFVAPIELDDGSQHCSYHGAIVTGTNTRPQGERSWTTYVPLGAGEGFRFLWLYSVPGNSTPQTQTVSVFLGGPAGKPCSIAEIIQGQVELATYGQAGNGQEMSTLIPLSVLLLLTICAGEPDLEELAPESHTRPQQLATARVGNLGWRTGSALRTWRRQGPQGNPSDASLDGQEGDAAESSPSGRRLPPHIRRAHWHRVRVATRDANGRVIGSRTGVQGEDWAYQLRLYPPTPVGAQSGAAPVVRALD